MQTASLDNIIASIDVEFEDLYIDEIEFDLDTLLDS